jgi:phosphoglycolate phosphatase
VSRYRVLIFDWDGTLADSAGMIVRAMQRAITGLKLPARSDQQIAELIGLGLNEALVRLYPEFDLDKLRGLLDGYRAQWLSEGAGEAELFTGTLDALRILHGRGHRLAIATGKSRRGLDRSLRHHRDVASLMAASRCADETASKPDPLMLRQILEELAIDPAEALMIGDTDYDVAMARTLGMPALGVTCGVHDPVRLEAAGAMALLPDVSAVPAWVLAQGRA